MVADCLTLTQEISQNEEILKIISSYSDLYAETPQSITSYFGRLLADEKPAVSIEIYDQPKERVEMLKSELSRFLFVYGSHLDMGSYTKFHLSVSKMESIARNVDLIERSGFADNAGTIGLLLGYSLPEVIDYAKNVKEDRVSNPSSSQRPLHQSRQG